MIRLGLCYFTGFVSMAMHEACQVLLQLIGYVDVPVACQVPDGLQQVLKS